MKTQTFAPKLFNVAKSRTTSEHGLKNVLEMKTPRLSSLHEKTDNLVDELLNRGTAKEFGEEAGYQTTGE